MFSAKTFWALFLCLFFISCGIKKQSSQAELSEDLMEAGDESQNYSSENANLPPLSQSFDVNAKMLNFNKEQEEKITQAIDLIKRVVASSEFRNRILNKKHEGKKGFYDNEGLSNAMVYKKILIGAETMGNTSRNNTMDLELELYSDTSNTIGYTYPNVKRIWMNKKYFNKFRPYQVADNMFHEWLHKLGFKHTVEYTPSRRHSIPYSVGYIVRELAKKYSFP